MLEEADESQTWLVLQSGAGHFAFNMALDHALLEAMPRLCKPLLRFYSWTDRAASFGYFQKYAQIEKMTLLRPLVRRPTAGGLVPHDDDWTYSLIFPNSHARYSFPAIKSHQCVHEWLRSAFESLGIATELAENPRKTEIGQCFVGYEMFDLLWHGRKIAGAAQRRRREGLLIQGSVQPPPIGLVRADWEKAMCVAARSNAAIEWTKYVPDADVLERAKQLQECKYALPTYNQKR